MQTDKFVTPSGATSSHGAPRFDLIPFDALKEIAERYALGAEKHGDFNWVKGIGDNVFERDRYNHALTHLQTYWQQRIGMPIQSEDTEVQNLAAAAWGCITLLACELRKNSCQQKPSPS